MTYEWLRDDFAPRWYEAWNGHDADLLCSLLTTDVVYLDDSYPEVMHGHAPVRKWLAQVWQGSPDMNFTPEEFYVTPGTSKAAIRWIGRGTQTGKLFAAPPSGRSFKVQGADLITFRDGLIADIRVVVDTMQVARQLGHLPPLGSRADRIGTPLLSRLNRLFG